MFKSIKGRKRGITLQDNSDGGEKNTGSLILIHIPYIKF